MKRTSKKKLPITKETLRTLRALDLEVVVAGMSSGSLGDHGEALTCCCNEPGGGGGGHNQQ